MCEVLGIEPRAWGMLGSTTIYITSTLLFTKLPRLTLDSLSIKGRPWTCSFHAPPPRSLDHWIIPLVSIVCLFVFSKDEENLCLCLNIRIQKNIINIKKDNKTLWTTLYKWFLHFSSKGKIYFKNYQNWHSKKENISHQYQICQSNWIRNLEFFHNKIFWPRFFTVELFVV